MKKIIYFLSFSLILLGCSEDEIANQTNENAEQDLPIAIDDEVMTILDTEIILADLLANDTIFEFGRITSFDALTEKEGKIVDNRNKTLTYTPPSGFTGIDTFTYTLCDNKLPANCSTATVTIEVRKSATPVLVDDVIDVEENTEIIINTLLENDVDVVEGILISSIDGLTTTGTIVLNNDGTITYTPADSFTGDDTFTYTVCNDEEKLFCDTATVTLRVSDQGSPSAMDDTVNGVQNTAVVFSNLLDNDTVIDNAAISSVDDTAASGSVVLNNDGTVTYTPQANFTGSDTFRYTLCDNDTPDPSCATATVTVTILEKVSFSIPMALATYYQDVLFTTDADFTLQEIKDITTESHTTILSYGQRHNYLYNADEDESNADNVVLMYSGESRYWEEYTSGSNSYSPQTFNTEHIFPQSRLDNSTAVGDLHHLRACDASVNSQRSNFPFANGSGAYQLINGDSWYPGDDWRGDVARMIMYVHVRYGDSFDKVGNLALFLEWNAADPVSSFERQRNNIFESAQGNRNPFIDNPYLATLIWGGAAAENTWSVP
ncbi:Ig-like domain-containing protein [Aquimarina sp. 2304DJ70-9]|uniref:Ig-like domain-containing protein n=1 Tax=Aquimarina penaris TaxID=3231044 RepID=UPI0034631276